MTTHVGERDEMERRLVRALESAPEIAIPEDFAMRVAGKVPAGALATRRAGLSVRSVGIRIAWVAAALLLVAIFVLAPSAGTGARHWLEFGLAIEFAALTAWLTLRPLLRR